MKKFKSVLAIVLMGVMTLSIMSFLFGCNKSDDGTVPPYCDPWKYKKEDQGFYYAVYSKDGIKTATILGLVDEEQEIEELIIPEKLGGYKVVQVGDSYPIYITAPTYYYGIETSKIKTIIINNEVYITDFAFKNFNGVFIINADINFQSSGYDNPMLSSSAVVFNIAMEIPEPTKYSNFKSALREAHCAVNFDKSGGELNTHEIFVLNGELLPIPKDPFKKDAIFDGWYKDVEYQNEWNFEKDTVMQNITLYAKWLTMGE